jgi:hypothetical protein
VPNTYIKKAERERDARTKKTIKTLLDICDDSTATPETKLGAIRQLKPIQALQEQLLAKNEEITRKDEESSELKGKLDEKHKAIETLEKELKAALNDNDCHEKKIYVLETDNKKLTAERANFDNRFKIMEGGKNVAIESEKKAKAEAKELIGSLKILVDEFVPVEKRRSTGLRQFEAYGFKLSGHWYLLLDTFNALRYERELKQLRKQMAEAKKQQRQVGPGIVYLTPDHAEFFSGIFLYALLIERNKWQKESLIDFFRSEGVDYSKWLSWEHGEAPATNDERERKRFLRIRQEYGVAVEDGLPLSLPTPT